MACSIAITTVQGVTLAAYDMVVEGTAEDCLSDPDAGLPVRVSVSCTSAAGPFTDVAVSPGPDGVWRAFLRTGCVCGSQVFVRAACLTNADCPVATLTVEALDCIECPFVRFGGEDDASIEPPEVECNPDGSATATFIVFVQNFTTAGVLVVADAGPNGNVVSGNPVLVAAGTNDSIPVAVIYQPPLPLSAQVSIRLADPITGQLNACRGLNVELAIPRCGCPEVVTGIRFDVDGCAGRGNVAIAQFEAIVDPTAMATGCQFFWNFGDGFEEGPISDPSITHEYATAGDMAVAVQAICAGPCFDLDTQIVPIPSCDGGDDEQPPSTCGTMVWYVGAAVAIAAGSTFAAFFAEICTTATVPLWIWWVIVALWAAVALLIALWYVQCRAPDCPCPTKCDWLQIATMGTLAPFTLASWLTLCCTEVMVGISIGLGLAFFAALGLWYRECRPSRCTILLALLFSLVSVAGQAMVIAGFSTKVLGCSSKVVGLVIAAISTVIAALAAANCSDN